MRVHPRKYWIAAMVLLATIAGAITAFKVLGLDYRLADVLPRTRHDVSYDLTFDASGGDAHARVFLPVSDPHQQVLDERNDSPGLHFSDEIRDGNRIGEWAGGGLGENTRVTYAFGVLTSAIHYDIAEALPVPETYPEAVSEYLKPEAAIQSDHDDIRRALRKVGADRGTILERLRRIYDLTSALAGRSFKGTTDALTALRLNEASCNGKSRLFVALARAAGLPARLVGGLILESGSKRTSHQWVEIYVAGHWVPFCATNRHFAALPANYLVLYRGDEALFKHSADINFDYRFTATATEVPSPKARTAFQLLNVWALFERLKLPFSLLATVLMLPVGALVVVLFRNVVGVPTFGTFLPALIAAAASETGLGWGLIGLLLIIAVVALARAAIQGLGLLHSPTLAILLAAVTLTMLGVSLAAERFELTRLSHISLFPIAVLALSAEKFYLTLSDEGAWPAIKGLLGTVLVIAACYAVMASLALRVLLIAFPEMLLLVLAANVYLGRWTGLRVSEYWRFRRLLAEPAT
jgi:hypothetical protein